MYEKHKPENMKALLLLDNAPAHPSTDLLRRMGKLNVCFFLQTLPPLSSPRGISDVQALIQVQTAG
jgi:hypothetical protein